MSDYTIENNTSFQRVKFFFTMTQAFDETQVFPGVIFANSNDNSPPNIQIKTLYNETGETLVADIKQTLPIEQIPFVIQLTNTLLTIQTIKSTVKEQSSVQVINSPQYLYELIVTCSPFQGKTKFNLFLKAFDIFDATT